MQSLYQNTQRLYKWALLFFLMTISLTVFGQTQKPVDINRLEEQLNNSITDTTRIALLNRLSALYISTRTQKASLYISQAIKHASSINYSTGLANAFKIKGQLFHFLQKPVQALQWIQKADSLYTIINEQGQSLDCQLITSQIFSNYGKIDEGIALYKEAYRKSQQTKYNKGMANAGLALIKIFTELKKYKQASQYIDQVKKSGQQLNILTLNAQISKTIGVLQLAQRKFTEASQSFQGALEIYQKLNQTRGIIQQYHYLGLVKQTQELYEDAIRFFHQSISQAIQESTQWFLAHNYLHISKSYMRQEDWDKSQEYAQKAFDTNSDEASLDAAKILMKLSSKNKAYKQLLGRQKSYQVLKDSIQKKQRRRELIRQNFQLNIQKSRALAKLRSTHLQLLNTQKTQKNLFLWLSIVISAITLLIFVWLSTKNKKAKNNFQATLLEKTATVTSLNNEITQQKTSLNANVKEFERVQKQLALKDEKIALSEKQTAEHKQYIYDSMVYTSEIQKVLLPDRERRKKVLSDHFILFKPREILSGDFYWMKRVNPYVVVVTADCSGQGVPSAILGMLAISFLNNIIQHGMKLSAGEILDKLREKVKKTLKQEENTDDDSREAKGRIEMGLAMYDLSTKELQYAGAYNALHIIRSNEKLENFQFNANIRSMQHGDYNLLEVKADKQPVGRFIKEKPFSTHAIKLEKNDKLYMFTNGYVDQPNYKNRLFNKSQLKSLLLEIHDKPMTEQQEILDQTFQKWRGDKPQTDDLLVMGVKID